MKKIPSVLELETPALLLDHIKLKNNIAKLKTKFATLAIDFRPHLKTTKCIDIARLVLDGLPKKITVSTLKEAEYFAREGIDDIIYAVGITPDKLNRVLALYDQGTTVHVMVDNLDTALQLQQRSPRFSSILSVLIEIDSDGTRAGLKPDGDQLLEIARTFQQSDKLKFSGLLTHAGSSYQANTVAEIKTVAEKERQAVVAAAEKLKQQGFSCEIISAGSTPTAVFGERLDGLTEFRAGVYMFNDLFQANLGVCNFSDIALSVLCSVIGHQKSKNTLIVDAGALALSKDISTASQTNYCGYGLIQDPVSNALIANLFVQHVSQEHGQITSKNESIDFNQFPIGTKLKILPNHACMMAAPYSSYHVHEDGHVIAIWDKIVGW